MTNTKNDTEKIGLTYLTALIPQGKSQTDFLTEVANSLNSKGLLPKTARKYNFAIVQNIWYGRYNDENVESEVLSFLKTSPCKN